MEKCINQAPYRWWPTDMPTATWKQEEANGPHPAPRTHNCPLESLSHLFPKYPRGRSIFLLAWDQLNLLGIKSDSPLACHQINLNSLTYSFSGRFCPRKRKIALPNFILMENVSKCILRYTLIYYLLKHENLCCDF